MRRLNGRKNKRPAGENERDDYYGTVIAFQEWCRRKEMSFPVEMKRLMEVRMKSLEPQIAQMTQIQKKRKR